MNFISDNTAGAAPEIMAAIQRANQGIESSYGADTITTRLNSKLSAFFEKEVAVFPVATGTAANALAIATITPHFGAVLCHEGSHINVDECGAPEFYSGAKLVPIKTTNAKLTPSAVKAALAHFSRGNVHQVQPATISITQATELGTVYTPDEVQLLSHLAKAESLALHMDGARFANALAHLKCTPAELTWKSGVDVLSFGATKNGALAAEAVIFFNPSSVQDLAYRRKRGGHLLSKMRFVSAQLEAMLDGDLLLKLAAHANAMAKKLEQGLRALPGFSVVHPVQANEVFVKLPSQSAQQMLEQKGAEFYLWEPVTDGRPLIRLVCSFATKDDEVEAFLMAAKKLA